MQTSTQLLARELQAKDRTVGRIVREKSLAELGNELRELLDEYNSAMDAVIWGDKR